jgi:hypothetical protein
VKYLISLLLLFSVGISVANGQWTKTADTSIGTYYADLQNMQINGHLRRVWMLANYKKRIDSGAMSEHSQEEYDCERKRNRTISFTGHFEPMAKGSIIYKHDPPVWWGSAEPGSIAESQMNLICSSK